jgi:hypothetical protein
MGSCESRIWRARALAAARDSIDPIGKSPGRNRGRVVAVPSLMVSSGDLREPNRQRSFASVCFQLLGRHPFEGLRDRSVFELDRLPCSALGSVRNFPRGLNVSLYGITYLSFRYEFGPRTLLGIVWHQFLKLERAHDLNVVSVEVAPVGLRDIFLETVKEN